MHPQQIAQLEKAKQHAIAKGGKCLSTEYVNAHTKLKWQCSHGHDWEASCNCVINKKSWCPQCNGKFSKEEGLKRAKEHAIAKGGKCLSTEYINSYTKIKWRCSHEHVWVATFNSVLLNNSWCPKCYNENKANSNGLKIAQEYAKAKGGECLSNEYVCARDKLKWKCVNNHIWESKYTNVVLSDSWCPQCSNYYYKEHKIRDLLEYLIEARFEKNRPKWNMNPKTNKPLELDGYCEKLKIAFEFQGEHHYSSGSFNNTQEDLEYIQYKDEIKKQNCLNNNVKLIILDDKFELSEEEDILNYIIDTLEINFIPYNKDFDKEKVKKIFSTHTNHQSKYLEKAKEHAKLKDGECLSECYINHKNKLKWKCNKNHEWLAVYNKVVNDNRWCPVCARKISMENLKLGRKKRTEKSALII